MNENPTTKKTVSRRTLVITAIIAIVAVAAGIIIPVSINAANHRAAVAEYAAAEESLAKAQSDVSDALGELTETEGDAVDLYERGRELLAVAKGNDGFFDSADTIAALEEALVAFAETVGIEVAENDSVIVTGIAFGKVTIKGAGLDESASTDELTAATAELGKTVKGLTKQLTDITDHIAGIATASEVLAEAQTSVVAAGEASGVAWERPAKTQDDAWAQYQAALEAIAAANLTDNSDLAALTGAYIDARVAAQKSHDDKEAADQLAAAVKQQQQSRPRGSGGGSSGGSGGGGGGIPGGRIDIPGGGGGCPPQKPICFG